MTKEFFKHLKIDLDELLNDANNFRLKSPKDNSEKIIFATNELLEKAGFEVIDEGLRNQWNPDDEKQTIAIEYGMKIAGQ